MQAYQSLYEGVLAFQPQSDGQMCGLLPLARHRKNGNWVVAGGHQCEYQVWLATQEESTAFIEETLRSLIKYHGLRQIQFRNIPNQGLLDWAQLKAWRRRVTITPEKRSLIDLRQRTADGKPVAMRRNRNKLNRLKRMGKIRFELVKDRKEFQVLLPDIEYMYDFRLGAAYGARPFELDPHKGPFHLKMMETPGLLHVTVLKVGDDIVSFHIGNAGGPILCSGLHSYSPEKARLSPVYLHLELLASKLADENYQFMDLGSGDEPYKQFFANQVEPVYELEVYADAWRNFFNSLQKRILTGAAELLSKAGVSPQARSILFRSLHFRAYRYGLNAIRRWAESGRGSECFGVNTAVAGQLPQKAVLNMNRTQDLLRMDGASHDRYQDEFIRSGFKRLSSGQRVYTAMRNDRLMFCAWMVAGDNTKKGAKPRSLQDASRVDIRDIYVDRNGPEPACLRDALLQLLADTAPYHAADVYVPKHLRAVIRAMASIEAEFQGLLVQGGGLSRQTPEARVGRDRPSWHELPGSQIRADQDGAVQRADKN
jgi:hypothetical protein